MSGSPSCAPSLLCVGLGLSFLFGLDMLKMFLIRSRMVGFCLDMGVRGGIRLRGALLVQLDKELVLMCAIFDAAVAAGLRFPEWLVLDICAICRSNSRKLKVLMDNRKSASYADQVKKRYVWSTTLLEYQSFKIVGYSGR